MLSEEKKNISLANLRLHCGTLSKYGEELLEAVNDMLAKEDVALDQEALSVKQVLKRKVQEYIERAKPDTFEFDRVSIYQAVIQAMIQSEAELKHASAQQPRFNKPLHLRLSPDHLVTEDVKLLMPKPSADIEVLDPIEFDRFVDVVGGIIEVEKGVPKVGDAAIDAMFLKKKNINHLLIPVCRPGHWQAVCLTKPNDDNPKYVLELFDPLGSERAKGLEPTVLAALKQWGIQREDLVIEYKQPLKVQGDGYACGDFVCGYCQQKVKEFLGGVESLAYNQELITAFVEGNDGGKLREKTRKITQELTPAGVADPERMQERKYEKEHKASEQNDKAVPHLSKEKEGVKNTLDTKDSILNQPTTNILIEHILTSYSETELSAILAAEEIKGGNLEDEELAKVLQAIENKHGQELSSEELQEVLSSQSPKPS